MKKQIKKIIKCKTCDKYLGYIPDNNNFVCSLKGETKEPCYKYLVKCWLKNNKYISTNECKKCKYCKKINYEDLYVECLFFNINEYIKKLKNMKIYKKIKEYKKLYKILYITYDITKGKEINIIDKYHTSSTKLGCLIIYCFDENIKNHEPKKIYYELNYDEAIELFNLNKELWLKYEISINDILNKLIDVIK